MCFGYLDIGSLELIWSLEFGDWNFTACPSKALSKIHKYPHSRVQFRMISQVATKGKG